MFKTSRDAEQLRGLPSVASGIQFWSFVELEVAWPWFYLQLAEDKGTELFRSMLMVPTASYLEDVISAQAEQAWIERAFLVTPDYVNGSDRWMMEPLLEVASIRDLNGREQAQQFRVEGGHLYTLGASSNDPELESHIVFSAECHLRAC
ncbi:hypothetical protein [Stutzerimonas kunmingensis]|uniref:hypothetical protein n=1 Tax=Stutzerimonas kunmingensis TaxID=1211807 RepID=UPI003AB82B48